MDAASSKNRPAWRDYEVPAFHPFASENPELRWNFWVRHYANTAQQQRDWRYRQNWDDDAVDGVLYPRASGLVGCTGHNAMIVAASAAKGSKLSNRMCIDRLSFPEARAVQFAGRLLRRTAFE